MLYLDYCATTPLHEEVANTIADVMRKHYGNPSSLHHLGLEAERLVTKAREVIAEALHCRPGEIVFTSGGTESNNLAVKGAALQYRERGKHLITSEIEHASVYESFKQLESLGFEVTYLRADETGTIRAEDIRRALREDTILVSLMHVNNETGRIQPTAQIGKMLRDHPRVLFHVDAVQSIGKLDMSPQGLGADLLSVSAHKIHGPKGTGVLYVRDGVHLTPIVTGGGQESGRRSGTENVPLVVGMAKAVRLASEHQPMNTAKLYKLRERMVKGLEAIPGIRVTGSPYPGDMAPHVIHLTLDGLRAEVAVHAMEERGFLISTRSACASGEISPSRVLLAMGMDPERASSGLRISYPADLKPEDADRFVRSLAETTKRLARA